MNQIERPLLGVNYTALVLLDRSLPTVSICLQPHKASAQVLRHFKRHDETVQL